MADHHFVPQFYLKGFLDPDSVQTKNPWLWVANLPAGVVKRRAPKNVAARAGYNAVLGSTESETAEEVLSQLEAVAAPIVRRLINGVNELTGQEWVDLLFFAAFLAVRTPYFRNRIEGFAAEIAEDLLRLSASHPDYYHRSVKETALVEMTEEEIEASRQTALTPGGVRIKARPVLSLLAAFQGARDDVYPNFSHMRWAILRADRDLFFVTSDNPVSWADPTPRPAFYAGHGLRMRNVEVVFPVGPQVCLFGTWNGAAGSLAAPQRLVEAINRRVLQFASEEIYAHREELARAMQLMSARKR
jgi:hypothetical protein